MIPEETTFWITRNDESNSIEIVSCYFNPNWDYPRPVFIEDMIYYLLIRNHTDDGIETEVHTYVAVEDGHSGSADWFSVLCMDTISPGMVPSHGAVADDDFYRITSGMISVDIPAGEPVEVGIPGLDTIIELTANRDLTEETIVLTETPRNVLLNVVPFGIDRYVNILVSENISNALEKAIIRVNYSEENLSQGQNELSLRLYYWNDSFEGCKGWEPIAVGGVNTEENYV